MTIQQLSYWLAIWITITDSEMLHNVHKGHCYWWSYADSFFITDTSFVRSSVMTQLKSRSFLQCCTKCDVSEGCIGVAYRAGECNLINGTAALNSFVQGDGSVDDFKVMMYDTKVRPRVCIN